MTKLNPKQEEGEKAIDNLLVLTSDLKKKVKKINKVILELEEMGVFL